MIGQLAKSKDRRTTGRARRRLVPRPLAAAGLVAATAVAVQAATATPQASAVTARASAVAAQPQSGLGSVSCTSPAACIAVGARVGNMTEDRILAEQWNGKAWSLQTALNPRTNHSDNLLSIACASPSECFTVGSIGRIGLEHNQRLIEMWNGSAWSVQAVGNPKGTLDTQLNSVSCGGPAMCFAVGEENGGTDLPPGPLVERWNGTKWSVEPFPTPPGDDALFLTGVSCVSPSNCTAVGYAGTTSPGETQVTVAEHFNGTGWTSEPTPSLGKNALPQLTSVSCSAATCMALGLDFSVDPVGKIAEWFNGKKWSVVPLAQPAHAPGGFILEGSDCTSPSNCYAVGSAGTSGTTVTTLIERWNGQSWAIVASPNRTASSVLIGISCASGQSCMAVGNSGTSQGTGTASLAMELSAGHWTILPTPSPS